MSGPSRANHTDQQDVLSAAFSEVLSDVYPSTRGSSGYRMALSEALSGVIPAQEEVGFDDVEEIINQLEQDVAVQAILDPFVDAILNERNEFDDVIQPDNDLEDEGIELNLTDEIDIEPFDYELEVF